jgi:hypothetical protein
MDLFQKELSVGAEDIEIELGAQRSVPWADFLLNPRRLRGSDFLMRWSQGVWSEERLVEAVNRTGRYFALPYGPSGTAPHDDVREFELYFERLEAAGLGQLKRPDVLIFRKSDKAQAETAVGELRGVQELPFASDDDDRMKRLLRKAVLAVECENSLWRAGKMPDYGSQLKPQRRLGGSLGLKKSAVLPTVIVKQEDRPLLRRWEKERGVAIHIWHVFYDAAFGLALDEAERLIRDGAIEPTEQVFQAPGGPTTKKTIYKFYYHYAYPVGNTEEEPRLLADHIEDENGHILPYVRFEGGRLTIAPAALGVLDDASSRCREGER